MNGSQKIKLGDVVNVISKTYQFKDHESVVFINTGDILEGKFLRSNKSIPSSLPGQAKKSIQKGDILFSEIRPTNKRYALVDFDADNYVVSTKLMVLRPKDNIDPQYLYTWLTMPSTLQNFQMIAESRSGTFPQITFDAIKNEEIPYPPLSSQHRIANILSSFDNKIELLRKENNTLEDIAQSIFKEWFVKYNFPNKDGKPYRDNNGKMIDSELGLIPEGWRVGKLGEIVEIKNGFAFKSEDYQNHGYPIIRTMNFEDSGYINNQSLVYISEQKAKDYESFNLDEFDLCVVMVGASLGKTVLVTRGNLPALQNQNMWSFKPKKKINRLYNNFVLQELIRQNLKSASGSAREFFRKDHFYNVDVIIPSDVTIPNFDKKIRPIFQNLSNNLQKININTGIKTLLLSKLIK